MQLVSIVSNFPLLFYEKLTEGVYFNSTDVGRFKFVIYRRRVGPWWRRRYEYHYSIFQWVEDAKTGRPPDISELVARRRDEKKGVPSSENCRGGGAS